MTTRSRTLIAAAHLVAITTAAFAVNPGELDPTFSGDGVVITAFDLIKDGSDAARAVALFADGAVALAGEAQSTDAADVEFDLAFAKFGAGGALDSAWGTFSGRTVETFDAPGTPKDEHFYEVAVGTDGKVVAAGWRYDGSFLVVVIRLDADGAPDASFTGDGKILLSQFFEAIGLGIDSQNRIVLGATPPANSGNTLVTRFKATSSGDGADALDADFAQAGTATISQELGSDIIVLPDDRVVVASRPQSMSGLEVVRLRRYTASGAPDASFGGGDGLAEALLGTADDRSGISALSLDPQGRYVALGWFQTPSPSSVYYNVLARFLPSGDLDEDFGTLGVVNLGTTAALGYTPWDVAAQSDGKILLVGGDTDATITRYDASGNLDTTFFPPFGSRTFDYQSMATASSARSVAVGPDGRIVVTGSSDNSFFNRNFAVARFESGVVFCDGFESQALYGKSRWSVTVP